MNTATLFDMPQVTKISHPAKYTDSLFPVFVRMLRGSKCILDPFGGTGKIFQLQPWLPDAQIEAIEIEPEWCAMHPRTTLGNALALPWPDGHFDAICTSVTYGNRMADCHNAKDDSRRNTYTHTIGRKLHPDNSGAMQWGAKYRAFHISAWVEAKRVLRRGGILILNCKNHIRAGKEMHVTEWHRETLKALGFLHVETQHVATPSQRHGANGDARLPYESVIMFEKVTA
jgi:SAM-dependent methyltransferase